MRQIKITNRQLNGLCPWSGLKANCRIDCMMYSESQRENKTNSLCGVTPSFVMGERPVAVVHPTIADKELCKMGMTPAVEGALRKHGITTMYQLNATTNSELLAMRGVGPAAIKELNKLETLWRS